MLGQNYFAGVYLALRGHFIANNSNINIRSIGQYSDALLCITDKSSEPDCTFRDWYFPNGDLVLEYSSYYFKRGGNINSAAVSLNRYHNVISPTGQFCCKVPDATYIIQTLCVIIGKTNLISVSCMNIMI